jgi:hypothetical protein
MPKKAKKRLTEGQGVFVLHGMVATIERIKLEAMAFNKVKTQATFIQGELKKLIGMMGG